MQITQNHLGMLAELTVAADVDARDHCVVVVKGTFEADAGGELHLAGVQCPLVGADEHHGSPDSSSPRYECDFAPYKPLTDVIVVGKAVAPKGQLTSRLPVRLEIDGRCKDLVVYGDREWIAGLRGLTPSEPRPLDEVPLTFERAWGGLDAGGDPQRLAVEERNPVGVGFHPYAASDEIEGRPVPNIELMDQPIRSPRERYVPAGYGCIGRSWLPRRRFAGTYDERWREERAPFLPEDFDQRYFQCAPPDQQLPHFKGGEQLRCVNMAEEVVSYSMPVLDVRITFRFASRDIERRAVLDTVTLEPHLRRALLVWRASVPLGKRLTQLREVIVGTPPAQPSGLKGYHHGKPVFAGLDAAIRWLRRRR
jgi:hypothetical protein